jgi:hypothetical protein
MYISTDQSQRLEALRDRAAAILDRGDAQDADAYVHDLVRELDSMLGPRKPKEDTRLMQASGIVMPLYILRSHASVRGLDLFDVMGWDWGGRARDLERDASIGLTVGQAIKLGLITEPEPEQLAYTCAACKDKGCYRCSPDRFRVATDRDFMIAAGAPDGIANMMDDQLVRYGVPIDACCPREDRDINGGCKNCKEPCL